MGLHKSGKSGRSGAVGDNFFQSSIQLKGWVSQPNPFERHGKRWHLYLSRVEILRRLAARNRKNVSAPLSSPSEDRPA